MSFLSGFTVEINTNGHHPNASRFEENLLWDCGSKANNIEERHVFPDWVHRQN